MWALAVLGAILAAGILRLFVAEAFRIPTESMAPTVLSGDFVLVSKLHYGARTPERLRVPLTHWHVPLVRLPSIRLPGLREIRRGDVVVFYHPAEHGPLERRTPYVKRVVGLPGDTVEIRGKRLFASGQELDVPADVLLHWVVRWREEAQPRQVEQVGALPLERVGLRAWRVRATAAAAAALYGAPGIEGLELAPGRPDGALFPPGSAFTPDDYGPVVVPRAGQPFVVRDDNWSAVRVTLEREGRHARRLASGAFEIDGAVTDTVIFEQDYFFVIGDNRDESADSRRWGFVPRDHLIGKAVMVYFSWDPERARPRLERLFRRIR